MACENKKTRRLSIIIILCLMFCDLPLVAPRNIDCKGKPFHCVNSTHFIICVDLGGGISSTVDDVIIPCPESTICDINNHFECEFPPPTTLTLPIQPSDVSNESGLGKNKVITKVSWENIDITTTSSVPKTSERSEKYLNNASIITILEEFTTTKAKLEAITDGQSTTIHQDNINRQSNNNEKQYQQFPGNSTIDVSNNMDVAQSDINKNENTKGTKSNSYTIDIRPTETNEELKDRKLSSMRSGTESTPLQNSISSTDITELYSYTPGNRDVITLDSSFTTNSEILTSDVMSVNTPMLSNSRSKSSKMLESDKETTPYAINTESKKTSTVEPKVMTLSYDSSNLSSQIKNDNSTAEATLNESNPVKFVNESINSTIEAKTSRKINEYQSSNSSTDMDKISYFNEVNATESFTNITPRVSEKYLQSNSTQDHLSSIVSENKYLESEQLNNTMDKYEQKNTTNIISDITTRPNITDVQNESANKENSDMSVSNPMEILPAIDSSIFTTHKQDKVRNQVTKNITKINIHEETTMSDLSTNYYVTDSYGVNYDQSTKMFDVRNFHKNGYTTNTFGTKEVTATTTAKNNDITRIVLHNNTETTRANKSNTKFLDNASTVISSNDKPEEDIVWHRTQTKIIVPYNQKDNGSSKNLFQSTQTTNSGSDQVKVVTTDSNLDMITITVPNYNSQKNKEEPTKNMSKTHEDGVVKHETQKNITTLFIHGGKGMSDLNNESYVKEDSNMKNQYQSTQTTNSGNEKLIVTTADSNIDIITTTVPNYNFEQNKEETTKNMSKILEDGVKPETPKNITTLFIHGGKGMSDLNNESYVKKDSSSKNQYQSTQTTNFGNEKVIVTTADSNIDMITTSVPNYKFQQNKEATMNNMSKIREEGVVQHEPQKNITTLFIYGGKGMSDLNNENYVKEDSSSKNQYQSNQTTNSGNEKVIVTTADSNIDLITTTVPNYNFEQNKEETTKNISNTLGDGVKHEPQKNITMLFIHGGKAMSDLNNKSFVKDDGTSKNEFQSTQTTYSGNDQVKVTITDSNLDMITITVPNYNSQKNKEEPSKNMSKTDEDGVVKHETQKNITTLFIHGGKVMSDLNNKSYAKDDSSSKNQYQSTQTTNSGNGKIIVTTAGSNIDMITTTVPNYNFQQNKETTMNNMSKIRKEGLVKHEPQKNITTLFIHGGKGMRDLNNEIYVKEDSSMKNQYQSTQTTNFGNDQVKVTITDSNLDMITITVPNYNSQKNKEEPTKNMSKTHEDGVVKHETNKNITTLFIHGGKSMSDLNNESYVKEDSSSKNQYQSTQTTNSRNGKVIVTTADSNIDMTTTVPNYNFQQNKEATMNNVSKIREEGVVKHEPQKNITTLFIHGGKGMNDLNNESYVKEDSNMKNQYQSTQTTNSGNKKLIVTTADSNIDIITTTVPNYYFEQNKEETTKNMSKILEDGVKHETQKNITTPFIHGGKAMSDLSNKSFAKDDGSSKNEFQSTQTTNFGNDQVKVTITDSNLDMITITVPNYNSQKNKQEPTKNMSKTHEDGVVKHETQKNITTLFIHGEKGMSDLSNESYVKEDSNSKSQYQSTQTTNSGNRKMIVTTADSNIDMITTSLPNYNFQQKKEATMNNMSKIREEGVVKHEPQKNITTLFIHGGNGMSDLNNESYVKEDSNMKNQYQSTQTTNSGNEKLIVTTADSNIDIITTTVPNDNFEQNKEETTKNMSKILEDGVKHETQKNITTPFIHGGKAMSDLSNKSFAKDDGSSKNEFQSTQTTNFGNDQVKVTITDSNLDMITITVPNYNSQKNKQEPTKNMSKTHEDGVVKHETQKKITTLFTHGEKGMSDLSNESYVKEDSSSKSQYQSTQKTNSGNGKMIVTTADSNIDMITTSVPNYNFQQKKEATMNNMSNIREEGVVKHEPQKNITTLFIHGGNGMSDLSNESYVKEDSSSKSQYQSTQTTNSGNEKVIATTADSNIDMITTTVPNYNFQQNKEETMNNMSKIREEGVVKHVTQKNITTLFIHGGKAMSDLSNKSYAKDDGSSKNEFQSTQTTNSANNQVKVTITDSNLDMITISVTNYNSQKNKEETMNNMSKIHKEGVVKHETQKNITTLFIHGGKGMSDSNDESYVKEDSSSKNQYQSTRTTNSGNEKVIVTTADSNIDMITTTVPNYYFEQNKEETTKNMSKILEDGVKHETQKNITTPFIHGGKAMSDLSNKSFAKDDSSRKNQFQSTQTTNSGAVELIVTTADSNMTTSGFDGEKATSDLNNNKSYAKDNDSKILYQSTQTSNQSNFRRKEFPFNNSKNSSEAVKIIAMEHNTTITTDVPDFMFTKVDDSGLTTNLNNYIDTFVSTYNSNTHFTKSNIDTDRFDISDRFTTITERNINGDEMTSTQITNDMAFKPKSASINEFKSETKSSTPISTVKGTNSDHRYFAKTFGDGKLEKNFKLLSNNGQEISSRTNRQAGNQMDNYNLTTTTIIVSEIPPNSSRTYGEDLTAKRVPNYPDMKVSTKISEDFNSYTLKETGITEKYTMLSVIDAKNLTTVAEEFLTAVSTASYNLPKEFSTTSISKESMSGITFVNNGRETTLSSSSIINTNIPQYGETKVVESKSLQTSLRHSLNIEADTTTPSSESDKVTSVINRAVNTRHVTLLKKKSHTKNYQVAESPALSSINLTSLAVSPSNNKILHTSVTNTLVDTKSPTDTSTNQPQQLKKTKKLFNYFYTTDAEVNENKPNKGIIKSIQSRDLTESKASSTGEALRLKEKISNESILNNNQQSDIIPSELSIKVGSNTGLHASTIKKNIAQISKHFKDMKQNSSGFLSQTTHTHYASSTISSLEKSDGSITTTKMKINTASTIWNKNDMSGAPLVTESTINEREKKSKTNDIAKDTLLENMHKSDSNISSMTLNKYKDLSNNSNSNTKIDADRQADSKSKDLNKNLEITSERTNFLLINGQKPYIEMSVNSNYRNVSNDTQRVSNYYTDSTTRGSIKTITKNTTTMAKRIRDVNAKSTNTDPTNVVFILFDYGRQTQKKEGKSVTNDTNFEENPDDNIHVDSSSHNRYENSDPNDIKVEPMTKANNADNDNDPQNSSTPKVDGRINDTDMVLCGRYTRGRYPDKTDCRKFYICVGRNPPIRGTCPNNTVYSESRKQCTKNLSHCVRNNNFKCLTEGRFSDFLKDDIYHICIKNKLGDFALYKFQCQNGFRLDKKTVKCIKEPENSSSSVSSASENFKSNNKTTTEKTSKVTDKFECQEEGKFADTRDCRTYYVCSKKRNVYRRKKKKCESDERFDRDKKKCVDAESYECDI